MSQKQALYEHVVRAVVYADSPEKQCRVEAENKERPYFQRIALNGLYEIVYRRPNIAKTILSVPYRSKGFDMIGLGRNSTVLRDGDAVIKIARASMHMSKEERYRLIDELSWRHSVSREHLGDMCVDQSFQEIKHPVRGLPVVASTQDFIDFEPFKKGATLSHERRIMLADLAKKSQAMERESGLVSDVSGTDNLGFDEHNRLRVVDTIPLKVSDGGPSVQLARKTLEELAAL